MPSLRAGPFVRATTATSAVIWAEFFQPGQVTLSATPFNATPSSTVTVTTPTVTVEDRYYAAPQLPGLQPATWYTYRIDISSATNEKRIPEASEHFQGISQNNTFHQCFRTLDSPAAHAERPHDTPLRVAYGSCRNLLDQQEDSLSAFGSWLIQHFSERESLWPHLLLLIGDQIYADEPSPKLVAAYPQLRAGARTFADFAWMYEQAWTQDEHVRQLLAMLPTFTIFDDHEIINNWNITSTWRARALQRGREQLLVDGLVAYWIYQGWGNLHQRAITDHPLLQIMHDAATNGADALEALRACILQEVLGKVHIQWRYEIPTAPPIFVMDVRADRPAIFNSKTLYTETPARIMSSQQMGELVTWLYKRKVAPAIVVSSVPVLLPPVIGLAEYLMGIRPWYKSNTPLRWLGRQLARMQHKLAIGTSFDHWPVFATTWHELVETLKHSPQDILVLSGDVHFSYAMEAHPTHKAARKRHLYQFVSTPLQNELGEKSRKLVVGQARLKRIIFGGLHMRMLSMLTNRPQGRVPHDLLIRTAIALVTVRAKEDGSYEIRQDYLGVNNGEIEVIGRTDIP